MCSRWRRTGNLRRRTDHRRGALIRVTPNGEVTRLVTEGLTASGGVGLSPQGGNYVTNIGTAPASGEVVRINLCDPRDPRCQEPKAL